MEDEKRYVCKENTQKEKKKSRLNESLVRKCITAFALCSLKDIRRKYTNSFSMHNGKDIWKFSQNETSFSSTSYHCGFLTKAILSIDESKIHVLHLRISTYWSWWNDAYDLSIAVISINIFTRTKSFLHNVWTTTIQSLYYISLISIDRSADVFCRSYSNPSTRLIHDQESFHWWHLFLSPSDTSFEFFDFRARCFIIYSTCTYLFMYHQQMEIVGWIQLILSYVCTCHISRHQYSISRDLHRSSDWNISNMPLSDTDWKSILLIGYCNHWKKKSGIW